MPRPKNHDVQVHSVKSSIFLQASQTRNRTHRHLRALRDLTLPILHRPCSPVRVPAPTSRSSAPALAWAWSAASLAPAARRPPPAAHLYASNVSSKIHALSSSGSAPLILPPLPSSCSGWVRSRGA